MITTLFRTPVRPSIFERRVGLRVSAIRPATTARPSREPWDVRIKNRMSLSRFILFASACNVFASVSTVALPPVLVLYFTTTGLPPNRLATICAALVASRRKTPSSPNRPNDTTVILRGFSAACTAATVDANVRRNTMTGALSRLTKDSIVTTNLHFNNVQGMCELPGARVRQNRASRNRSTLSVLANAAHRDLRDSRKLGGQPILLRCSRLWLAAVAPCTSHVSHVFHVSCGAKTKAGTRCQSAPIEGRTRCRLHGGLIPGAPRGAQNGNYRNGEWTAEATEERKWLRSLVRAFAARRM